MEIRIGKFSFDAKARVRDFLGNTFLAEITSVQAQDGRTVYGFACENPMVALNLIVVEGEHSAAISVECGIDTAVSYDRQNTFFSYEGITVTLTPENDGGEIFANGAHLQEKNEGWMKPVFCSALHELPRRLASLLWKSEKGFLHVMPVADGDFLGELHGAAGGLELTVSSYTGGYRTVRTVICAMSWGEDCFALPEATLTAGFAAMGKRPRLRKDRPLPEPFHYLGWCSWDSFHKEVNAQGILQKAKEFCEKDISVRWYLVDDGWFEYTNRTDDLGVNWLELASMTEDRNKFPQGLKDMIHRLKGEYGASWVGVWQCFLGYWRGIDPKGKIASETPHLLSKANNDVLLPRLDEGGNYEFWNCWNDYLYQQGVDLVKVDVENSMSCYTHGTMAIGKVLHNTHSGMEGSVAKYYHGACINCTGMGHESLWQLYGSVNRNSSDFLPMEVPSMRSFVAANLYNSYYHSQWVHTDWDMLWSQAPTTDLNVVMHTISGALLYVSDPVGESDPEVLKPFARRDGKLLRCDDYAVPTEDTLFVDTVKNPVLTKGQNTAGKAGVVGVFNLYRGEERLTGEVSPGDISKFSERRGEYLVWQRKKDRAVVCALEEKLPVTLESDTADLFWMVPVEDGFAALGCLDKYVSPATIEEELDLPGEKIFRLWEGGRFGFWCDREVKVFCNGKEISPQKKDGYFEVDCREEKGAVWLKFMF